MKITASGRAALMIAAGLWVCLGGFSQASAAARETKATVKHAQAGTHGSKKYAKHHRRHSSKHASARGHKKFSRVTSHAKPHRPHFVLDIADADDSVLALPPEVANAHAQAATSDATNARQPAVPSAAESTPFTPAAGSDQLNDVDLTLSPDQPAATPVPDRPITDYSVVASKDDDKSWSRTSLVGKMFIAFGGLLTLASAARMFMA